MKHAILIVIGLFVGTLFIGTPIGLSVGWYFGYQRHAEKQAKLIEEYKWVRESANMTDAEFAELGTKVPQYMEDVKRQDEMAAIVALSAFQSLERGEVDATKRHLASHIGIYYNL